MKVAKTERGDLYYTIDEIEVGELLCHDVETVTEYEMGSKLIDLSATRVLSASILVDDDSFEQRRPATPEECKLIAKTINRSEKWLDLLADKIQ